MMCQIFDFSACGHRDIDRTSCTNPNPVITPCKPLSTYTLPSECSRCRESYLRTVTKRSSVMALQATRAALEQTAALPTLFAWPKKAVRKQKPSRRGRLRSDHLEGIPESPTLVREERGWSPGLTKSTPCQPTPAETTRVPDQQATSTPAHTERYSPQVVSNVQHMVSHPPSLTISRPQQIVRASPHVISTSQHTVSLPTPLAISIPQQSTLPPSLVISRPQPTVQAPPQLSSTPKQTETPPAEKALPPTPAARFRPTVDRNISRLTPRDRSARLRDAYHGTETSHTPAVAPPPIKRNPFPSYPAWTTLPSQIEERTKEAGQVWKKTQSHWDERQTEHTHTQELFLATPVKEIDPVGGGLPSCLKPADTSQANNLSRLSTFFNLFSETGRESSVETIEPAATRTYTTYSGAPAVKRVSELPKESYAAHQARRNAMVEFADHTPTAVSTPTYVAYNPLSQMKGTSQLPALPREPEDTLFDRDRSLTTEKSLSELSASFDTNSSCDESSVEFVSSSSTTTCTLTRAKSLSELSAIFDMQSETQIEIKMHSPTTPTATSAHSKVSAWVPAVKQSYVCYNPLASAAKSIADSILLPQLSSVRPLSVMKLGGAALDGVFGTWSRSS